MKKTARSHSIKINSNKKSISLIFNASVLFSFFALSIAGCDKVEKDKIKVSGISSEIAIQLLSDIEWLAEGSGVLLTTDKGYINGYTQSMMTVLENGKKGECYTIKSESGKVITIHKTKTPNLDDLKNETEDLVAERTSCK